MRELEARVLAPLAVSGLPAAATSQLFLGRGVQLV